MVSNISIRQMPAFKKAYKKLQANVKEQVNKAISTIMQNPTLGESKKGDLAGVFVYKFKEQQQQFLLAYEWNEQARILLGLGVQENFYRDLKKTI